MSSTCPDSPELETKCDKVGKCDAAAMVPYDGPASSTSSTCPDESRHSAKSQLTGCDQHQDASEVTELREESVAGKDDTKSEIITLESRLLEIWNCSPQKLLNKKKGDLWPSAEGGFPGGKPQGEGQDHQEV